MRSQMLTRPYFVFLTREPCHLGEGEFYNCINSNSVHRIYDMGSVLSSHNSIKWLLISFVKRKWFVLSCAIDNTLKSEPGWLLKHSQCKLPHNQETYNLLFGFFLGTYLMTGFEVNFVGLPSNWQFHNHGRQLLSYIIIVGLHIEIEWQPYSLSATRTSKMSIVRLWLRVGLFGFWKWLLLNCHGFNLCIPDFI